MTRAIAHLPAISSVVQRYSAFLIDAWGVLHDGGRVYPGAVDCLRRLREAGKKVIVLSNAGRRAGTVAEEMIALGIGADRFDAVVSSGEETWQALKNRSDDAFARLGRACFYMGPARSRGLLAGLDLDLVTAIGEADFVLNSGVEGNLSDTAVYEEMLQEARTHGLTMVCANPDLVAIRAGRRGICAGAIASRYEELGGSVLYRGKPHPEIYATCFDLLDGLEHSAIVAVGDALRTDIAGAAASGIDSILIAGGIHAEDLRDPVDSGQGGINWDKLEALCAAGNAWPAWVTPKFSWS
jgi:HAD superfamily hydrolase (TIGR01459 family)